ncbi:MAG TPA: AbrB/MazE/SpoVT family DNA-binding domain-containing protein [Candidatus Elarobacter sp.]|jgi:antitoxin component of MazEF toxin-antitoxin module
MASAYPLPPGTRAQDGDFVKLAHDSFDQLIFQDARVFKTGNSLAIRIPSAIAKHLDLRDGSPVDMSVQNGLIWVKRSPTRTLQQLVDRITVDNLQQSEFNELGDTERW